MNAATKGNEMKIYNNNDAYGDGGPFEAASFEALADEMRPTFEEWAREAADDPDCQYEATRDEFIAAQVAELISGFILELSVVCEDCGTHGPAGDDTWTHTADECEIIRQENAD